MIIVCPYCYQHIDTQNKEKSAFEKDKILTVPCPKCKLKFTFSKDGVSRIQSEIENLPLDNSCCVESSAY